jgi:hypothetical protein
MAAAAAAPTLFSTAGVGAASAFGGDRTSLAAFADAENRKLGERYSLLFSNHYTIKQITTVV